MRLCILSNRNVWNDVKLPKPLRSARSVIAYGFGSNNSTCHNRLMVSKTTNYGKTSGTTVSQWNIPITGHSATDMTTQFFRDEKHLQRVCLLKNYTQHPSIGMAYHLVVREPNETNLWKRGITTKSSEPRLTHGHSTSRITLRLLIILLHHAVVTLEIGPSPYMTVNFKRTLLITLQHLPCPQTMMNCNARP